MADNLSILLVGGHPADSFDNAGGTMAHHAAAGDRERAIQWQQQALKLANQTGRPTARLEANLERYRQGGICPVPWEADDPLFTRFLVAGQP